MVHSVGHGGLAGVVLCEKFGPSVGTIRVDHGKRGTKPIVCGGGEGRDGAIMPTGHGEEGKTQSAGFEPARHMPSDFESDALTTRPRLLFMSFERSNCIYY